MKHPVEAGEGACALGRGLVKQTGRQRVAARPSRAENRKQRLCAAVRGAHDEPLTHTLQLALEPHLRIHLSTASG